MNPINQRIKKFWGAMALATAALAGVGSAAAQTWAPSGVMAQGGVTTGSGSTSQYAGVGLVWGTQWGADWFGGRVGYHTELQLNRWNADQAGGGNKGFYQLAVLPIFRTRTDGGRSRFYAEGGIGPSVFDDVYRTRSKSFSTAFQFTNVLGAGYNFGLARQHEVGFRVMHVSNGSIKSPNPGENLVVLRYSYNF